MAEAAFIGAALLAYSNGLTIWAERHGTLPDGFFQKLNPLVVCSMLLYAWLRPGRLASVGLQRKGLGKSLAGGVGMGLALSAPPLFFFHKPLVLDSPLEYGPIAIRTRRQVLTDILVWTPVGTAILEELGFRGLLYSALRRRFSAKATIALSSLAFAGWHYKVTATSVAQSNLTDTARLPRFTEAPRAVVGCNWRNDKHRCCRCGLRGAKRANGQPCWANAGSLAGRQPYDHRAVEARSKETCLSRSGRSVYRAQIASSRRVASASMPSTRSTLCREVSPD